MSDIIAIGGGGFGRNPKHNIIEQYLLNLSDKEKPNILFIPTASAEDKSYIINFYTCFSNLNCNPYHLSLFGRTPRLDSLFSKADIIYIGGGNTKSMLAVWKDWKIDILLKKAYEKGKILCGVSAGAICWFEDGVTDSWASNLNIIDCLGFIKGSCCPHYNGEVDRRPSVNNFLQNNGLKRGVAIEDGSAIHYKNGSFFKGLSFYKNSKAFFVSKGKNNFTEKEIELEILK